MAVRATNRFRSDFPVARSAYLHQVAQIAPAELIGREHELASLASFCTSPTTSGCYLWWRAEAWSGKTALLSSFVLDPPAHVRVVSFFITGRLSGQNDQTAFLDNVLEQLFTLLREDVPELLTEATKHAHLLRLLDAATADCLSRSESFVLVVDGLDEDNGAGGHSIASLLPVRLPDGMRVVVAGRPNPPADAPDDHPLRSGLAEVRSLEPSPAAVALRRETERELKALLHATDLEKDLLGLICAAGGGLTAADLAELTGASSYEVEDCLCTIAGRSFARRDGVYLLAHEELQGTAVRMFGPRLAGYRDRLHSWADVYDDQSWPESTPEYLLHGYAPMLRLTHNPVLLMKLVTGRERQALLRQRTGGDAVSYSQILSAQQVVAAHTPADLLAMTKLAAARGEIGARNGHLPVGLPAVWELIGQSDRAAALAHGIVKRSQRSEALAILAKAVAESGDLGRGKDTADSIVEARWRARAFTDLTLLLAQAGDSQQAGLLLTMAEAAVSEIGDDEDRARALVLLARALHALGHQERATAMLDAAELHDADVGALLTTELAACAEATGDSARANRIARASSHSFEQVILLGAVATEAHALGHIDRASALLDEVESIVMQLDRGLERVLALADACEYAAPFGSRASTLADLAYAEAEHLNDDSALVALINCSVASGDLIGAEDSARGISEPLEFTSALAKVARLALECGDKTRADALITELAASDSGQHSLSALSMYLIQIGESAHATTLAEHAETLAHRGVAYYLDNVAADVASAFCLLGQYGEAEAAAFTITSPRVRADALRDTAAAREASRTTATTGAAPPPVAATPEMAAELAQRAELARSVDHEIVSELTLANVAAEMATAGLIREAEELAAGIEFDAFRDMAMFAVAIAVAKTGEFSLARRYVDTLSDHNDPARLLDELAIVAADAGEVVMARQFLMQSLAMSEQWSRSLKALGKLDPDALREISALLLPSRS